MRHGVLRIVCQRLSQDQFGFVIAILDEQRPRLANAAEAGLTSSCCRTAETADRLVAMAECVDQGAGAEPRLGQGWLQLSGAVVGSDSPSDVALLLQGDSQAEIFVCITRIAGNRPLQGRDAIRYAADLQAGEA